MALYYLLAIPCAIGTAFILSLLYNLLQFLTFHFWVQRPPLKQYATTKDNTPAWAFITGSSAGIGLGLAQAFVLAGFNVIIHSHRLDELESAAKDLAALREGAKVEIVHFNALGFQPEQLTVSLSKVKSLPITVLVNNVGGSCLVGGHYREFSQYSSRDIDTMLDLNMRFATHITNQLLPTLTAQPCGLVINISSGSRFGMPLLSIYSSSKGYVDTFSHCIDREARMLGSHVRSICIPPGDVKSQANHIGPFPARTPLAGDFGRDAVRKMDTAIARGMTRMQPDWTHDLQVAIAPWLPVPMWERTIVDIILQKKAAEQDYNAKSR